MRGVVFRTVSSFTAFCVFVCLLGLRLFLIGGTERYAGLGCTAALRVTADFSRAMIYDTNGLPLVNEGKAYIAAARPDVKALERLRPLLSEEEYARLRAAFEENKPAVAGISEPVEESESLLVASAWERYDMNSLARHVVGYTASDGAGVAGMERAYNNFLINHGGSLTAVFPADANGKPLLGSSPYWENEGYDGQAGLKLTIDKEIQRLVEYAMDSGGIARGAALVLEIGSGAIRAMASRPNFDQGDVASVLDSSYAPLLNRAILPFAVGSVFKPVVAAAALEAGISEDICFECKGYVTLGGVTIRCWQQAGHGKQNLKQGIANSCNPFFIQLAQQLPPELLLNMARAMGFGQASLLAPGISSAAGRLPSEDSLLTLPAALANFSFGQGDLTATPLQLAAAYACIASGGEYSPPYLVEGLVDDEGRLYNQTERGGPYSVIERKTAFFLQDALLYTVTDGTAGNAKSDFIAACGKTGTAQTARFDEEGNEYAAAWFAGFFPAWEPKYVVVVFREDGRGGGTDCAPVFKQISEQLSAK